MPGDFGIAGIAAGPAGDSMWFTENDSGKVGAITLTGSVGERLDTGAYPFGITAGPDGNMWYCVGYGNAIGRVNLGRLRRLRLLRLRLRLHRRRRHHHLRRHHPAATTSATATSASTSPPPPPPPPTRCVVPRVIGLNLGRAGFVSARAIAGRRVLRRQPAVDPVAWSHSARGPVRSSAAGFPVNLVVSRH